MLDESSALAGGDFVGAVSDLSAPSDVVEVEAKRAPVPEEADFAFLPTSFDPFEA
jgi:hypothetical protein